MEEVKGPQTSTVRAVAVSPFPSLYVCCDNADGTGGNIVGLGTATVVGLSNDIAFKFARQFQFDEGASKEILAEHEEELKTYQKFILRESNVYAVIAAALSVRPNPNILQPCFAVPEGILMPRLKNTLQSYEGAQSGDYSTFRHKLLWAKQIANGIAWLESMGYVHGDLRPLNILIDKYGNAVLADFGGAAPSRTVQVAAADLYYPYFSYCGHWSENYAMGWCLYSIFNGSVPTKWNDQMEPLKEAQLPATDHLPFGEIMFKCWRNKYSSVKEMEQDVLHHYKRHQKWFHRLQDHVTEALRALRIWMFRASMIRTMQMAYHDLRMENLSSFWQV